MTHGLVSLLGAGQLLVRSNRRSPTQTQACMGTITFASHERIPSSASEIPCSGINIVPVPNLLRCAAIMRKMAASGGESSLKSAFSSRNSLLFSLFAGNLVLRPVRIELGPLPAAPGLPTR